MLAPSQALSKPLLAGAHAEADGQAGGFGPFKATLNKLRYMTN
jgi:hypothetical protein